MEEQLKERLMSQTEAEGEALKAKAKDLYIVGLGGPPDMGYRDDHERGFQLRSRALWARPITSRYVS